MIGKSVLLAALAATLSTSALARADDSPPAPAEKQRLICRGAERTLGSHIRRARRCRTAEQWQQEDEERARPPVSMTITEGQNDGRATATPR